MLDVVFGMLNCLVLVVVGGVKVSFKIDLFKNLVLKVDVFVIGGGMVNMFFVVCGYSVGKLLCEYDLIDMVK